MPDIRIEIEEVPTYRVVKRKADGTLIENIGTYPNMTTA